MSLEERLELLLRRETQRYQPNAEGFDRITAKMTRRRRRRIAGRTGAGILAAALVAAVVVALVVRGGGGSQSVAVGPSGTSTGTRSAPALVSVSSTRAELISPMTGQVLRQVRLPSHLAGSPIGQIAASLSGSTAYVAVDHRVGDTSCPYQVVAVNLRTGAETVAATDASAPAVNPDGTELAFLTGHGPSISGSGPSCTPTTVTVEDLRSGQRRSWRISPAPSKGRAIQDLESLSWAPRGRDLLVGSEFGPFTGIQILDTAGPVSATNPATVGANAESRGLPGGRYSSPVEEPDGTIVAIAPYCWGAMSCPTGDAPTFIEAINRANGAGRVIATFKHNVPNGLVADPAGNGLIAEIPAGNKIQLVGVDDHKTAALTTVPGPAAWAAHATTPPAKITSAGKVIVTLLLSSHVIASGASMHARLIVDNRTGHAIQTTGCGGIFAVLLTNGHISNSPAWPLCLQRITFPTGRSTHKLTVEATYDQCGAPGVPKCTGTGMPRLPPGRYEATVFESNHALPIPDPQPVQVTAPNHSQ